MKQISWMPSVREPELLPLRRSCGTGVIRMKRGKNTLKFANQEDIGRKILTAECLASEPCVRYYTGCKCRLIAVSSFLQSIKYLYTYFILPVDLYVEYGFLMQSRADMSP